VAVTFEVQREGDRVFVAMRTRNGKYVTVRTTKRGGAALCAVLGQACGRRPAADYAMQIDGEITTQEDTAPCSTTPSTKPRT
jgi:hypothetical protein